MCKNKGLILVNAFSRTQIDSAMRLQEEFQKKGVAVFTQRNNEFHSLFVPFNTQSVVADLFFWLFPIMALAHWCLPRMDLLILKKKV